MVELETQKLLPATETLIQQQYTEKFPFGEM